jgi:hypothetical protein
MASDEMDYAMMGAPKIVLREDLVRFRGEIAIGEVQQLDPLSHLILAPSRRDGK